MTSKEVCEQGKGSMTLLAQGREIRTEEASRLSSRPTAKTAGDFLLNLDHAKITFNEIIVERHSKVIDEGEDEVTLLVEAFRKIARLGLLDATAFAFVNCEFYVLQCAIKLLEDLC